MAAGEDRVDYLASAIAYDMRQTRDRDHWFANQLSAVYTSQDLLHRDLMGDGTVLKPGILPVMERRLRDMPNLIRQEDDAQSYSTMKKWMWGVLGGCIVAGVAAILGLALGVHV